MNNEATTPSLFHQNENRIQCRDGKNDQGANGLLRVILTNLLELQKLDSEVSRLCCRETHATELTVILEELRNLHLVEKEKLALIIELEFSQRQLTEALEVCRQRLMNAESGLKHLETTSDFRIETERIEQLKVLEEGLEKKVRTIEKKVASIGARLLEVQAKQDQVKYYLEERNTSLCDEIENRVSLQMVFEIETVKSQIIKKIPAPYIGLYRRLINARAGLAVVTLEGNACTGCHLLLPPQFLSHLAQSSSVEQCPKCQRILIPPHQIGMGGQ